MKQKLKIIVAFVLTFVLLFGAFPASAVRFDDPFTEYYPPAAWKFEDVDLNRWSFPYIKLLRDSGVINGVSATAFEPKSFVTRAQFVKMLGRIACIKTSDYPGSSFKDVASSQWYAPYVQWAVSVGVTKGTFPEMFQPDAHIRRQDIATMIYRYVTLTGMQLPEDGKVRVFTDEKEISSYAKKAITAMQKAQIISGEKNEDKTYSFHPTDKATREQTAKMLCVLNECRLEKIRKESNKAYALEVMKNWIIANSNVPLDHGTYIYAETLVYEENNIQTLLASYSKAGGRMAFTLEVLTDGLQYRYTVSIPLSLKKNHFSAEMTVKQSHTIYISCAHSYQKDDPYWRTYSYDLNYLYNPERNGISDRDVRTALYDGGEVAITFAEYLFRYQIGRPNLSTADLNIADVGQYDALNK